MNFNKLLIYIAIIFLYLGLSKSLSPSELGITFVQNKSQFSDLVVGTPIEVILIDEHMTGFLIKTYYHKYRVVYGFQTFEELIVKVSRRFKRENEKNVGLSIFRRSIHGKESFVPLPPGKAFIHKTLGYWQEAKGTKKWNFYKSHKQLEKYLGLENFEITPAFFERLNLAEKEESRFIGFNDEFGPFGLITISNFPKYFDKTNDNDQSIIDFLKSYFYINFSKMRPYE